MLNVLESTGGEIATAVSLFCRYDALQMARVAGDARVKKMLASAGSSTFVFC